MLVRVSMKCPDALDMAIDESIEDEQERERVKDIASRWFKYGEYLTVEIDTDGQTCEVVPA